jgi:hypothetical protein
MNGPCESCGHILIAITLGHADCFLSIFENLSLAKQKENILHVIQTGQVSFLKKVLEIHHFSKLFSSDCEKRECMLKSISAVSTTEMFCFLLDEGCSSGIYHTCEKHSPVTNIICNPLTHYYSYGLVLKHWEHQNSCWDIKEPAE